MGEDSMNEDYLAILKYEFRGLNKGSLNSDFAY
jgi:hypothetical protein